MHKNPHNRFHVKNLYAQLNLAKADVARFLSAESGPSGQRLTREKTQWLILRKATEDQKEMWEWIIHSIPCNIHGCSRSHSVNIFFP